MQHLPFHINGLSVVVLFGILQGIMILLFFSQKHRYRDHQYLLYFTFARLFAQLHSFLVRSGAMSYVLFLLNTNTPVIFLFGPLILFYSKTQVGFRFMFREKVLHLLPFIFYLGYSFHFFLQSSAFKLEVLAEILHANIPIPDYFMSFPTDPWDIQGWVVVEIISMHLVSYGIATILLLRSKDVNKTKVSSSKSHWLNFLNVLLIFGGIVLFLAEGGVINGKVFFRSPFPNFSSDLFGTFGMYAVTGYLLTRPEFLKSTVKKYSNSALSREFMREKLPTIERVIEKERLFLDPQFSLDLLAHKTGLSKHHISQIINTELGYSFFDLTNKYRIEEAKRVMKESEHVKMEQLAYQLGYKSKSSFFNAFKKSTKLTPSMYYSQTK